MSFAGSHRRTFVRRQAKEKAKETAKETAKEDAERGAEEEGERDDGKCGGRGGLPSFWDRSQREANANGKLAASPPLLASIHASKREPRQSQKAEGDRDADFVHEEDL